MRARRLGHLQMLQSPFEPVPLRSLVVLGDTQLLLDVLKLLAQDGFALVALDLLLDVLAHLHLPRWRLLRRIDEFPLLIDIHAQFRCRG